MISLSTSKAIRMNIIQNPTGIKGRGRGVDWIAEHNNLYTKVSGISAAVDSILIFCSGYMAGSTQIEQ